jgi:hypothetical protein
MMADRDICASANMLIKRYGEDAEIEAAKRADELLEAGDMDGCVTWKCIKMAIEELQSTEKAADAPVH